MGALTELFGAKPRVRVLEAMLTLSASPFTAAEAARVARMHKPAAYRVVEELAREGLIRRATSRRPTTFEVNPSSPLFQLLSYFETSLNVVIGATESGQTPPLQTPTRARTLFDRVSWVSSVRTSLLSEVRNKKELTESWITMANIDWNEGVTMGTMQDSMMSQSMLPHQRRIRVARQSLRSRTVLGRKVTHLDTGLVQNPSVYVQGFESAMPNLTSASEA